MVKGLFCPVCPYRDSQDGVIEKSSESSFLLCENFLDNGQLKALIPWNLSLSIKVFLRQYGPPKRASHSQIT